MSIVNKDFKVKNGIQVSEGGTFGGPVAVGTPTDFDHAVTIEYLYNLLGSLGVTNVDGGNPDGIVFTDGGSPSTTVWDGLLDSGNV